MQNLDPWGRKIVLKPHPGAIIFKTPAKKAKHEIEIMKNSTEMLVCLEILSKTVKHIKDQSFFVGGFYEYSKYLKSFSIHL